MINDLKPMPYYRDPEVRVVEIDKIISYLYKNHRNLISEEKHLFTEIPEEDEWAVASGLDRFRGDFTKNLRNKLTMDIVVMEKEIDESIDRVRAKKMLTKIYKLEDLWTLRCYPDGYNKAMPNEAAIDQTRQERGGGYDPIIVMVPPIWSGTGNKEVAMYTLEGDCILDNAFEGVRRHGSFYFVTPHLSYSRHDKSESKYDRVKDNKNACLSWKIIVDAHSDVFQGHYNHEIPQSNFVKYLFESGALNNLPEDIVVVVPDAGAKPKYQTWKDSVDGHHLVQGVKLRDPDTGKLSGFAVEDQSTIDPFSTRHEPLSTDEILSGRHCLIIDDIIDGGGTFSGLGAILKSKGAAHITLAAPHGLLTKALSPLLEIDEIITFDWNKPLHNFDDLTGKVSYLDGEEFLITALSDKF